MRKDVIVLSLTAFCATGFVNPAFAAEVEKEVSTPSEDKVIAEISDDNSKAQKVLPAAQTNQDTLNFLELVDYFVTAERIPTNRWDTPSNVYIITAEEIEANNYQTALEALSHVNGLFLGNILNGTNRTVTLVDGHSATVYPPAKMIERIEIVKGGSSALYGSDAVGGVINIITKKGERNETTVDLNTGSWHTHNYEITNQGKIGNFSWFLDGAIHKAHPYNFSGSGVASLSDATSDRNDSEFFINVDNRIDDRSSLTANFHHSMNKSNSYGYKYYYENFLGEQDFVTFYDKQYALHNNVLISYNFKEGTNTPGFFRYFNNYTSAFDLSDDEQRLRVQGFDYQNGWEFDNHKLIAGIEWHRTNHSSFYWNNVSKKMTNSAYYIQDTISLNNKWTLVPGVRLDHNTEYGNKWSPKLAVNYRADDKTKVYASWGKVYRAPSTTELYSDRYFYDSDGYISFAYGHGRNMRPESGHVETIGFEHDFNDKTRLTTSFFNAKLNNLIDYQDVIGYLDAEGNLTNPYQSQSYINTSNGGKYRGFELNFSQQINDNWNYELGYTLLRRESEGGFQWLLSPYRVPRNSYRVGINFRDGNFKANLLGIFGTGSDNSQFAMKKYAVLDFNTSYKVADWATVYFKFLNFTNQNYSYFGQDFHSPGRSFMAGVTCKF